MITSLAPNIKDRQFKLIEKRVYRGRDFKTLLALVDKIQPMMRRNLAGGLKEFQKGINLYDIEELIANGKWQAINLNLIKWDELDIMLRNTLEKDFEHAILQGGKVSKPFFEAAVRKIIPSISEMAIPFSLKNPRIQAWKDSRLAFLKGKLKTDALGAVDRVIRLNWDKGLPPRAVSRLIRGSIGLNERQAVALSNYRNGLEKQGILGRKLDEMVGGYSDQLIKQRADTIAWTETTNAINKGQMEVWEQAAEADLIDLNKTFKVWVALGDEIVCEICGELNGQEVAISESFHSEVTGEDYDSPSAHVSCRCMMDIKFKEE